MTHGCDLELRLVSIGETRIDFWRVKLRQLKSAAAVKGAVDSAQDLKSKVDGFGGIVEGLKDKINGAAITDDSPAKSIDNVRLLVTASFGVWQLGAAGATALLYSHSPRCGECPFESNCLCW